MDCPSPNKGLNFDCNAYKDNAFRDDPYIKMDWNTNNWLRDYWCSKGQELRSFNERTKESEWWVATKDILDSKDIYCKYLEKQNEIAGRKLITAQTNFEWLNQT